MSFQLPEDLSKLTIEELQALHEEGVAAGRAIAELPDEDLTDEQLAEAEQILGHLATLSAESEARAVAAAERAERLAAVRGQMAADEVAEPNDEGGEAGEEDEPQPESDSIEAPSTQERTPVAASARPRVSAAQVARRAPAVIIPEPEPEPAGGVTLIAAANVPQFDSGAELADLGELSKAFASRSRGFQGSKALGRFDRYGVARIQKPANEFAVVGQSAEEQLKLIDAVANEKRLPGGGLVAAGGWCAPSETVYDLCTQAVADSLVSLPEINVSRGGLRFSKGVDFAALAENWGFLQTEAEAEAGTVKVCYEVPCPPFIDVRLDAIGFCISAGILTESAFPELIRQVLELGLVAHARKVNASVIARLQALIGPATNWVELGSATADLLDALSLQATVIRYQYSLAASHTIEAILPVWAKEIVRSDLSRRTGVDLLAVTDAQIQAYFGVRNIAVQWVYDYQPIATSGAAAGTAWPTVLEAMLYPAGAYVKGTTDVIDLDTVYDSAGLPTNTYTAAFFEEGLLVLNRCMGGRRVSIDISCLKGVTGAAELTCITTP